MSAESPLAGTGLGWLRELVAAVAGLALVVLSAGTARAHAVGVSRGEYVVDGAEVIARVTLARGDARLLAGELDAALGRAIAQGVRVSADGAACAASGGSGVALTEEDGVMVSGRFRCAGAARAVSVELPLLETLAHGHRHLAHVVAGDAIVDDVLARDHARIAIAARGDDGEGAKAFSALGLVRFGVEHILTGYDHLLFLLGLIVVGGRARSLVGIVTAFTVAHSITLAIAALGVWAPPSRFVEPAIALTIAYVGVENLRRRPLEGRWRLTFPFGLVHGFGFAGALQEIALPAGKVPLALLSFNAGVELGQLAVVATAVPLLALARRRAWLGPRGVRALSAGVVAMGLVWFVTRALEA